METKIFKSLKNFIGFCGNLHPSWLFLPATATQVETWCIIMVGTVYSQLRLLRFHIVRHSDAIETFKTSNFHHHERIKSSYAVLTIILDNLSLLQASNNPFNLFKSYPKKLKITLLFINDLKHNLPEFYSHSKRRSI